MFKRLFWSLAAIMLPFVVLVGGLKAGETAVANTDRIIINEIHADPHSTEGDANGDGIRHTSDDEFVELVNSSGAMLDLSDWTLYDEIGLKHTFAANTILDAGCAIVVFGGGSPISFGDSLVQTASSGSLALNNGGDSVTVYDRDGTAVASYTYGAEGGSDQSLVRNPDVIGADPLVKHTNITSAGGALFSPGTQTDGHPFVNCHPRPPIPEADLIVSKDAPDKTGSGQPFTYTITLQNGGTLTATAVTLTDTLPTGLIYLHDDSGYPLDQTEGHLIWTIADLAPDTTIAFHLVVTTTPDLLGLATNYITVTTAVTETNLANNHAQANTRIDSSIPPTVLIDALLYDGYEFNDADEAVRLYNAGNWPVNVGNWELNGKSIPADSIILPQQTIWLARDAAAFTRQFGFMPDVILPNWPGFANNGTAVVLTDDAAEIHDVLVYGAGDVTTTGWQGTAVVPYQGNGTLGKIGQILYRQRDEQTGLPIPDTDTAADWAQSHKQVLYPGWDWEQFFHTYAVTETAVLTIAVAPDNAYAAIVDQINSAQHSLHVESHTFEHIAIGQAFVQAAQRGVSITILLEGAPPGGLPDAEKYNCQQIEQAGGVCYFMINDEDNYIADRYRFIHAKFILVDGQRVVISSENLSPNSLPNDDKQDGTWGRRGIVLITDAPGVVNQVQAIFAADVDPDHHADIYRWQADDLKYGSPPAGFIPIAESGGITYGVRYSATAVYADQFAFELIQSPENSLRRNEGLLGLVDQAGAGDTILVQQLQERPYWGATISNAMDDPNVRLEAYIVAARRGASVRLLLDAFFDNPNEPTSNSATCNYLKTIAQSEKLRLSCAVTNPTGLGIHNKMVLLHIKGKGYIHVGSINGTEQSHKGNREVALQVQSDAAYEYLADVFERDWPHRVYLPLMLNQFIGPAQYALISEVRYDSPGMDDQAEFVELVNPTGQAIDLSNWSLSDAVLPTDYEDLRRFPAGTFLLPHKPLVIATTAVAFAQEYGFNPDFEIINTSPDVPDLIDDLAWGDPSTFFRLANTGDEVILRDGTNTIVDVVVYGANQFPDVTTCPLVTIANSSLERFPYWRDTNDCLSDFREWPFPSPGKLP